MNEFDYENLQKKLLARSAKNRVGTVRGPRGCSLPSDHMTDAQWRKQNGEQTVYNFSKPMRWKTFRAMPDDLKREYLQRLLDRGGTTKLIAEMFGVHSQTVTVALRNAGLQSPHGHAPKAHLHACEQFCKSAENSDESAPELATTAEPESIAPDTAAETSDGEAADRNTAMLLSSCEFTMHGPFRVADVAHALAGLPEIAEPVTIRVSITSDTHSS